MMIWKSSSSIECYAVELTRSFDNCLCVLYSFKRVHLWRAYSLSTLEKFKVCLNNTARMFFGYDKYCSATAMFVSEGIDNFDVTYRKAAWGISQRLSNSNTRIINSLADNDVGKHSVLRAIWSCAFLAK